VLLLQSVFDCVSSLRSRLGAFVETAAHILSNKARRVVPYILLILCSLVVFVLSGCQGLRLPDEPPKPPNPGGPANTVTIAPVLLTPAPTHTPLPTSPPSEASPTPTFALPLPDPTCNATPMWGLGDVWSNEKVRTRLRCPTADQVGIQGEELYFQNGHMIWRPDVGLIYVLVNTPWQPEGWGAFVATFQPPDPESDPTIVEPTPMSGSGGKIYSQPLGRFGKLWRENAWLRESLGWARVPYDEEGQPQSGIGFDGAVQDFEHGVLLWNGDVCFVLRTDDMSWDMY
jgi:hypothetical protein